MIGIWPHPPRLRLAADLEGRVVQGFRPRGRLRPSSGQPPPYAGAPLPPLAGPTRRAKDGLTTKLEANKKNLFIPDLIRDLAKSTAQQRQEQKHQIKQKKPFNPAPRNGFLYHRHVTIVRDCESEPPKSPINWERAGAMKSIL